MNSLTLQEQAILYKKANQVGFDSDHVLLNSGLYSKIYSHLGMDAAVTLPNAGVAAEFLQNMDRRFIDVFFAEKTADKIGTKYKGGDWEMAIYRAMIRESVGTTRPYSDYSEEQNVNANINYLTRYVYRLELVKQWGDLQIAENARALNDYVNSINVAASNIISADLNSIFFYGVEGVQNFGILNEPGMPTPLTPASIGTTPARVKWQDKTLQEIVVDLTTMLSNLYMQGQGIINQNTRLRLAMPPSILPILQGKISDFGYSSLQWIKDNLGNAIIDDVVLVPEFATDAGNFVMLWAPEINGSETINHVFGELYKSHGVHRRTSSYSEKVSASDFGAVVRHGFAIVSMLGV